MQVACSMEAACLVYILQHILGRSDGLNGGNTSRYILPKAAMSFIRLAALHRLAVQSLVQHLKHKQHTERECGYALLTGCTYCWGRSIALCGQKVPLTVDLYILQGAKGPADQSLAQPSGADTASKEEADNRSVYVGQVDYSATPEELQVHFKDCGTVNRVTILTDKMGNAKVLFPEHLHRCQRAVLYHLVGHLMLFPHSLIL